MDPLIRLSAHETVEHVHTGRVSRVEVVAAHFERIADANGTIGAICQLREQEALSEAALADKNHDQRSGFPLDGVPIVVKDQYDVAGLATSEGSDALRGRIAVRDSTVVMRLKEQGAIIIGKANQPDFAMRWNTKSSAYGWTRNPHDPSLSVGGSSGGDAAAVAAGMAMIGFGTDLAGSIRVPAAFCKVYGLRTTPGRVPFDSQFDPRERTPAVEAMSSQGPLARSVSDLNIAFHAARGGSWTHPMSIGHAETGRARTSTPTARRIARLTTQAGAKVDADVVSELDSVCEKLEDAGYEVQDAAFPDAQLAPDIWGELISTELRLTALPNLKPLMDTACFDHIDKLSQQWETASSVEQYLRKWTQRTSILRGLLEWMERYPLIISPIAGMRTPLLAYDDWASGAELATITARMRNCLWPAMLGLPAVALPQGCQIIARPFHDEDALQAAAAVESRSAKVLPV